MNKYYLLTFNDDYADEHNIPALECMTEEQYNTWLDSSNGPICPNYEEKKRKYDAYQASYRLFWDELTARGLANKRTDNFTKEETLWYNLNKVEYNYSGNSPTKLKRSLLHASLGNGGDGFEESYGDLPLMKDFVENKIVDVTEVDQNFYDTFHKASLSNLSLCNIFQEKKDWYREDDDDE